MFQVKIKKQRSVVFNTAFGIGLSAMILSIQGLPSFAGAQSLLDPYADVHPANKSESKIKKVLKQPARQKEVSVDRTAVNNTDSAENNNSLSAPASDGANKAKIHKAEKNKVSNVESFGFLSGIKEMQHGSMTSIKAAGGGIVNGSKAAGSKVAGGTKSIGGGIAAASSKVMSGPKNLVAKTKAAKSKKAQPEVANADSKVKPPHKGLIAKLPGLKFSKSKKAQPAVADAKTKTNSGHKGLIAKLPALKFPKFKKSQPTQVSSNGFGAVSTTRTPAPAISSVTNKPTFPVLPGKPLDQVLAQEKQRKHLKDVTFGEEQRKPGIITNAVGKIGFLHKGKKAPAANAVAPNLTANNPTPAPH